MAENKKHILVVDDDKRIHEQFTGFLNPEEFMVTCVSTVKEAMVRIDGFHFELIFLDLIMPGKSGLEVLEYIKMVIENKPKIVLMTSYSTPEMEMMAIEMGAVACIFKPLEKERILALVKEHILAR